VHTFFLLSALFLAAGVGVVGAELLRVLPVGGRRPLALAVLGLPPAILLLAATHLVPQFWQECAPLVGWDRVASFGLLGLLGAIGAAGIGVNLARLALVDRLLPACAQLCNSPLQAELAVLATRLAVRTPDVRVLRSDAPLAVTGGLRRPSIVLSTWLVEQLDTQELESVLSHELAHLARHDYLTRWLARLLRDATAYLPSGWYAVRVLETDEELAADALAVQTTQQPLAMASALGKVWRALATPQPAGLAGWPAYAGASVDLLEERLNRLMAVQVRPRHTLLSRVLAGLTVLSVGGLAPRLLALSATVLPLMCTMRY